MRRLTTLALRGSGAAFRAGELAAVGAACGARLRTLDLGGARGVTSGGLCALLEGCGPALRVLRLDGCAGSPVSDAALAALARQCPGLEELDARGCARHATDAGLGAVARGCSRLRSASLGGSPLVTAQAIGLLASPCTDLDLEGGLDRVAASGLVRALERAATRLRRLRVSSLAGFGDAQCAALARSLSTLQTLELDGATWRR